MNRSLLPLALFALPVLAAACERPLPAGAGVIAVESGDPEHPRLRYLDGQVSRNTSCAIRRGNRLNPRVPPMRVNGVPIGFC
jgi:hypothetical protein